MVTGASGNIGRAAAAAFAEAGADVVLMGRDTAKLEAAAIPVRAVGRRALVIAADVTDQTAMQAAGKRVADMFGRADILFNNAGTSAPKSCLDTTLAEWRTVMDTNLTGAFLAVQAFAPAMISGGYGRIVNMGSILSGRGMALRAAYCASKAGLANLGAALAFELGPHGITVNTIGATVIATDFNRGFIAAQPALYEQVLKRSAFGRLGEVEDLLGMLVFLASPAAAYLTGQTLFVDGGYTAG